MTHRDHFPALDGLRAVGAFAVLLTHVAFQTGQYPRGVTGAVLGRLDVGVALFFVLSGFLLSLGFIRPMSEGTPRQTLFAYAVKRGGRIWPVFAVTVIIATALIGTDKSAGSWWHSFTMTHLYSTRFFTDGLTQMWSLETEVAFYLVLPFLMMGSALLLRRSGWRPQRLYLGCATLIILNIVWLGYLADELQPHRPFVYQWLPGFTAWFGVGIALAIVWVDSTTDSPGRPRASFVSRLGSNPGSLWGLAFAALLIASTPLAGPLNLNPASEWEAVTKSLLYTVVAGALVIPAIFGTSESVIYRALASRPARYLGHLSYSVFCIHLVVLWYVMEAFGNEIFTGNFFAVAASTIVLSVLAAMVLYYVVERPGIRLSRRLARGRKAPPAASDTAKIASN